MKNNIYFIFLGYFKDFYSLILYEGKLYAVFCNFFRNDNYLKIRNVQQNTKIILRETYFTYEVFLLLYISYNIPLPEIN